MNGGLSITLVASAVLLAVILNVSPQLSSELNQTNNVVRDVVQYGISGFDNVTMGYSVSRGDHIRDKIGNLSWKYNETLKYVKNKFSNVSLPSSVDMFCRVINVTMNGSTLTLNTHQMLDKRVVKRLEMVASTHKNIVVIDHKKGEIIGVTWNGTSGKIAYCTSTNH